MLLTLMNIGGEDIGDSVEDTGEHWGRGAGGERRPIDTVSSHDPRYAERILFE